MNKCEKIALAAVRKDGHEIENIDNPSDAVQLAAVKQNGLAIRFIENPPKALQLAAVEQNGDAIQFITNPPEEVQLAAIQECECAIRHIANPPEALQLMAVQKDRSVIQYIQNPSEVVKLAAHKGSDINKREVERLAALPLSERMVLSEADTVKLAKLLLRAWNDVEIAEAEITSLVGEIASLTERIDKLEDEVHDYHVLDEIRIV